MMIHLIELPLVINSNQGVNQYNTLLKSTPILSSPPVLSTLPLQASFSHSKIVNNGKQSLIENDMHINQPELHTVSALCEAESGPKRAKALQEQGCSGGCDRSATTINSGVVIASALTPISNSARDEYMHDIERESADGGSSITEGEESTGYTMV